jgi:hypothetical protein
MLYSLNLGPMPASAVRSNSFGDQGGVPYFTVSCAHAPIVAASSCKPSVIVRRSSRSVSLPLYVVSIDDLGIRKGILGWRGHVRR